MTKIGEEAFGGCGRFTYVSIPANVAVIEDYTFAWCKNLTVVAIPGTVTVIGDCAFDSCDRLSDVYYSGSKEEWDRIVIGECNSPLRSVAIHYNSAAPAPSGTLVDLSTGETVMWALNDELSAVSVTGALSPSAPVFVASYDENGKMLSATCLTKPATVDLSDGDTARLFWLDAGTGVPKSDCAELAL